MRKVLIFIGLILTLTLSGQKVPAGIIASQKTAAAPAVDSAAWETEYKTVYYAMTNPPPLQTADYQNDMVASLVTDGYWSRMDVLYIFAQYSNTNSEALLNWKAPTGDDNCTFQGAPAFASMEGLTPSSANYIITNYWPATEGVNYTLDDASFGAYSRSSGGIASYDIGNDGSANDLAFRFSDDVSYAHINSTGRVEGSVTSGAGLCIVTRRADNDIELYGRGTSIASDTDASTAIPTDHPFYIGTRLPAGGVFSTRQFSLFFAMDGISDAENTALSTIFETYMDAIGKGVQ